jgi:hypothetical protein
VNFGEHQLVQRIKERFCMPEFAVLTNVQTPSGTFADAVAVNLWRSRGYEVVGFEVKSARSDWLREKKDPMKAEGCAAYCKTFWIVANEGVVKLEELPMGWGLLEAYGNGLRAKQKAAPLAHMRELTVPFMVNMIRRAVEKGEMTEELKAAREAGKTEGIELGRKASEPHQLIEARREIERYKRRDEEFYKRTGLQLSDWSPVERLTRLYRVVERGEWIEHTLTHTRDSMGRAQAEIDKLLKDYRNGIGAEEEV